MRSMKTPETNFSTIEFWHLVTHSLKDIVKSVTIVTNDEIPQTSISEVSFHNNMDEVPNQSGFELVRELDLRDWTALAWTNFGFCYMFKIPDDLSLCASL